jgi:hypothetical protein
MLNRCSFGIMLTMAAFGQAPVMPQLPNGPAEPGFDIGRFSPTAVGTFETFYVTNTEPLKKALADGRVASDTRVLVISTAAGRLSLITEQMVYHHIAQGRAHNKDWMATF